MREGAAVLTGQPGSPDLRAVALAVAAWAGALAGFLLPGWATAAAFGVATAGLAWRRRRGRRVLTGLACLLAAAAVAVAAGVRSESNRSGPVARLAAEGAYVHLHATVTSDPVLREGRFAPYVMTRLVVTQVTGRGRSYRTHVPVLALADPSWRHVRLGSTLSAGGSLARADSSDLAAVLYTSRPPARLTRPGPAYHAAARVRAAIRAAVAPAGPEEQALIPALVVGDDQQMSTQVVADFRTCGLTHLTAVSGTNLTLVVGFLLILARAIGVRARGLTVLGLLGVAGFVLLARPEPSVIRAAAMGSVALLGMGRLGRERGVRALGVAVFALLLFDPWLAVSIGFVLSALATAGIVFLAPPFRDALCGWLPRWLAEALAVPFAAQLVCTPVVAAISGQVSLVAVAANLAVAWAVGPATVLGLLGGLAMLVLPALGHLCGVLAGWCAWWIVSVATHLARLPGAAVGWPATPGRIALLVALCVVLAVLAARILRRRAWSACVCLLLVVLLVRPLPTPGWPPDGWALIACDVGQGDGLVLNAGHGRAVVVDTGPDPMLMDRCLREIGVRRLPVVVLTHYHADHVDGLPAVLSGRHVGEIDVTATRDPPENAAAVDAWAAAASVPVRVPPYGEVRHVGDLTWQVIGPVLPVLSDDTGEEGSIPNNASLVLLVRVHGISILMSGDMEPPAQRLLDRSLPQLHVDVLKVPHHGSRYQDPHLLTRLGARLAVISVGAHNDYGHPAASTLAMLRSAGMQVHRTDRDGAIAVVVRDGQLAVATRG